MRLPEAIGQRPVEFGIAQLVQRVPRRHQRDRAGSFHHIRAVAADAVENRRAEAGSMEEHVGVVVRAAIRTREHKTGEKAPVAKGAESFGLPGEPDDGREDHDRRQLGHAGERPCHSAPDDRVAVAGQQVGRESPDPEHREADHRRVGDEGAAEKDCRRRDGNQERGAARHSLVPDRIRETVDAGDCRQREHDRHQPADNRLSLTSAETVTIAPGFMGC